MVDKSKILLNFIYTSIVSFFSSVFCCFQQVSDTLSNSCPVSI